MSVIIYSTQHGGNGGPALNALATVMLVLSFVVAGLGYVGYRIMTRGERDRRSAGADRDHRRRELATAASALRGIASASTAMAPSGPQISGLMSSASS